MKVALVIEQFDSRRGGAEQWTVQFAARLLARRHEVHVLAKRFGEQVRTMPIVAHRLPRTTTRPGFAEAAQAQLLAIAPDVIHDMGAGWFCDVFQPHGGSFAALSRRKLRMVAPWMRPLKSRVDRLLSRHRQFRALFERQYVDDGRLMVALSRTVAADFQQFHDVPEQRIRLIYNGVDTERFSPERRRQYREQLRHQLGLNADVVLILIVTHNFRLKGVPLLLRALRGLKRSDAPVLLLVVGGKRIGGWMRAAGRLGVGRAVTFAGSVDDTVPYYAAADIYAHPTFYDSCSLVVLEALAGGLPVVTTRYNGAAELMTDRREGYVMDDPADLSELTSRLESLLDGDVRRRMGEAGRRLALKHTLEHNVAQMLAVYEESLQERSVVLCQQPVARGPLSGAVS